LGTRTVLSVILSFVLAISLPANPVLADKNPLKEAYFGETHVHTGWSFDAYLFGNKLTGPEDAYKYALGEPIKHPMGYAIQLIPTTTVN
jgi:hypothetical protein